MAFTASGNTAVPGLERPSQPCCAVTEPAVERRLSLLWGTQTAHQDETSYEQAVDEAMALIKQRVWRAQAINCAGVWHALWSGRSTNALRVVTI